jgi:hypothetical protein
MGRQVFDEPCHFMSSHFISSHFVPCHSIHFISCHFIPSHFIPCHFMSFSLTACHFIEICIRFINASSLDLRVFVLKGATVASTSATPCAADETRLVGCRDQWRQGDYYHCTMPSHKKSEYNPLRHFMSSSHVSDKLFQFAARSSCGVSRKDAAAVVTVPTVAVREKKKFWASCPFGQCSKKKPLYVSGMYEHEQQANVHSHLIIPLCVTPWSFNSSCPGRSAFSSHLHVHQAMQEIINHVGDCGNHWQLSEEVKRHAFQNIVVHSKIEYVAGPALQTSSEPQLQEVKQEHTNNVGDADAYARGWPPGEHPPECECGTCWGGAPLQARYGGVGASARVVSPELSPEPLQSSRTPRAPPPPRSKHNKASSARAPEEVEAPQAILPGAGAFISQLLAQCHFIIP